MDTAKQLARSQDISTKVSLVFQKRAKLAQERFVERLRKAYGDNATAERVSTPWDAWAGWYDYATDFAQRSILFWDTLRQRGNNYVEHTAEGMPPVLHFNYEIVLDARKFAPRRQLRSRAHHSAARGDRRSEAPSLCRHRPACGPRPGHRRLQGRFPGRRRTARRTPGVFRDLLPAARARPDASRRVRSRAPVRAQGARAAPGQRKARDRRQLPGRVGRDDARRRQIRKTRVRS